MSTLKLGNIGSLVTYDSNVQKMVSHKNIEIVVGDDKIIDIGTKLDHADFFIDCRQKLVTPGFVDCHTHPVFLDSREDEIKIYSSCSPKFVSFTTNSKSLDKRIFTS